MALILMALLVPPVHSRLEAQTLARVRLPQPAAGSLELAMRAQSLRLVVVPLRPTARRDSSNLALRPSR
jgi:hypothetical protein